MVKKKDDVGVRAVILLMSLNKISIILDAAYRQLAALDARAARGRKTTLEQYIKKREERETKAAKKQSKPGPQSGPKGRIGKSVKKK